MTTGLVPATKVITLFLLVTSILVTTARGFTKAIIVRSISIDDYLIGLSLVNNMGKCQYEIGLIRVANLGLRYFAIDSSLLPG